MKNSFTENVNQITKNTNTTLEVLNGLNKSLITDKTEVTVTIPTKDGEETFQIPAYNYVLSKLNSMQNSLNSFMNGFGTVELEDGTKREVKPTLIPKAPEKIIDLKQPTAFVPDANWFLEDLMFPRIKVPINLSGKINAKSKKVQVLRYFLNYNDDAAKNFYQDYIIGNGLQQLGNEFNNNNKKIELTPEVLEFLLERNSLQASTDLDYVALPSSRETYKGLFKINNIKLINGQQWFYLNNINYNAINSAGQIGPNIQLNPGDTVVYNETLLEVTDINSSDKRIRLVPVLGISTPAIDSELTFYNEPYRQQIVNIGISNNEINIIFIKGIDENYNLLANEWSEPIHFISNDLVLQDSDGLTLGQYYLTNVKDFSQIFLGDANENKVSSMNALIPNTPEISKDYFSVVQINTQLNSALEASDIKNTNAQIETTKSKISSLKETIASQKADLQSTKDLAQHNNIQNQINSNTKQLKQLQVEYRTSLKTMQDLINSNGAVNINPKFRIRGFFPIPEPRFVDDIHKLGMQQVIGFEIAFRYLKLDNTGVNLNTFKYEIDGVEYSGVYSDWNIVSSPVLQKEYNRDSEKFEWKNESIGDGNVVNINQVDISIQKGEKVEMKIRSISEAGYPDNPAKSKWSKSVIVDFPTNLSTKNQILNLMEGVEEESMNIVIEETLDSIGLYNHLDDVVPNPNSAVNEYFKHSSENIAYDFKRNDGKTYSIPLNDMIGAMIEAITNGPKELQDSFNDALKKNIKIK